MIIEWSHSHIRNPPFILLTPLFLLYRKLVIGYCVMQSYPTKALSRRLQVDWARDPREGPRVLMSLRVDFEPMG